MSENISIKMQKELADLAKQGYVFTTPSGTVVDSLSGVQEAILTATLANLPEPALLEKEDAFLEAISDGAAAEVAAVIESHKPVKAVTIPSWNKGHATVDITVAPQPPTTPGWSGQAIKKVTIPDIKEDEIIPTPPSTPFQIGFHPDAAEKMKMLLAGQFGKTGLRCRHVNIILKSGEVITGAFIKGLASGSNPNDFVLEESKATLATNGTYPWDKTHPHNKTVKIHNVAAVFVFG